jgi:hypothetical protein
MRVGEKLIMLFRIYYTLFHVALFAFLMVRIHYPRQYPPLDKYLPVFYILFVIANPLIRKYGKIEISKVEHIVMILSFLLPMVYGSIGTLILY